MEKSKKLPAGERDILPLFIIFVALILLGLSVPGTCQDEPIVQQGPSLNVIADVKPCIRMSLSTESIYFYAGKGPGIYEPVIQGSPDKPAEPVVVTVGCNAKEWSIQCEATPLEETATQKDGKKGIIPPSQLFVASLLTQESEDPEAKEGYLTLDKPVTILQGGAGETKAELKFKLETTWSDRAGDYAGKISFTCMMNP